MFKLGEFCGFVGIDDRICGFCFGIDLRLCLSLGLVDGGGKLRKIYWGNWEKREREMNWENDKEEEGGKERRRMRKKKKGKVFIENGVGLYVKVGGHGWAWNNKKKCEKNIV